MTTPIRFMLMAGLFALPLLAACSHEVSHSESDKPGWFGGTVHKESTVTRNPDGTTSTKTENSTKK